MATNLKIKSFQKMKLFIVKKKRTQARFAAKEAFSKALGVGIRKGIDLKNIQVSNDNYGKPSIKLKGNVASYLKKRIKRKKYNIYLSLSDDKPWAQATVIISYN